MQGIGFGGALAPDVATTTVTLRNGAVEARALVAVMMVTLRSLFDERPPHAYDLVMLCRDGRYGAEIFPKIAGDLERDQLIRSTPNGWAVHDSIRNVVLSSVEGDEIDMVLGNPVASSAAGQ